MFSVCIVRCGAVGACFFMQMFVSCVHPVAVLNTVFCMTCTLLMLVEDAKWKRHTPEPVILLFVYVY